MDKKDFEEIKSKFEKETRRKKYIGQIFNYASTISAFVALSVLVVKFFTSDYRVVDPKKASDNESREYEAEISSLREQLRNSKRYSDSLVQLKTIGPVNVSDLKFAEIENKLNALNILIMDNPEKAISIPILRGEINHLKEQNGNDVKSLREEIARSYDTNKWIVGLVCTMLISIIALNISNLLSKSKKD